MSTPLIPVEEKIALSIKEVCALSGLSRNTIYALMRDDLLPYSKVRKRRLIERKELEAFLLRARRGGFAQKHNEAANGWNAAPLGVPCPTRDRTAAEFASSDGLAAQFLTILGNTSDLAATAFWIETLDPKSKDPSLRRLFNHPFDTVALKLRDLNKRGAEVLVCVNRIAGIRRAKMDVCALQAWFVVLDWDEAEQWPGIDELLNRLPLAPSMWTGTQDGRQICLIWLMADAPVKCDAPARQAYERDLRLARSVLARYGANENFVHSNALIRLPGFYQCRKDTQPVLFHDCEGSRYTRGEFVDAFKSVSGMKLTGPRPMDRGNRGYTERHVAPKSVNDSGPAGVEQGEPYRSYNS